jgi:hypothetical protein
VATFLSSSWKTGFVFFFFVNVFFKKNKDLMLRALILSIVSGEFLWMDPFVVE